MHLLKYSAIFTFLCSTAQALDWVIPPLQAEDNSFQLPFEGQLQQERDATRSVDLLAGQFNVSLKLWASTQQPELVLFDEDCSGCKTQSPYVGRGEIVEKKGIIPKVLAYKENPYSLAVYLYLRGDYVSDDLFFEREESALHTRVPFLKVTATVPNLGTRYSGYIGIGPWLKESRKKFNFIYNLRKEGHIDREIVSISISQNHTAPSFIRFGGWTPEDIEEGANLTVLRPISRDSWAIDLKSAQIGFSQIQMTTETGVRVTNRVAILEPMMPFIYILTEAFLGLKESIRLVYFDEFEPECGLEYCLWNYPCDRINKSLIDANFTLIDEFGAEYDIHVPGEFLFAASEEMRFNPGFCFLAVFGFDGTNPNMIYLGNQVMSQVHTVFDLSTLADGSKYFLQLGLAPPRRRQLAAKIGVPKDEDSPRSLKPSRVSRSLGLVLIALIGATVFGLVVYKAFRHWRVDKKQVLEIAPEAGSAENELVRIPESIFNPCPIENPAPQPEKLESLGEDE